MTSSSKEPGTRRKAPSTTSRKTPRKRGRSGRSPKQIPTGLLVLGMHRSGTSAVAGALHELGVALGGPLMPAAPDNPSGFFEHRDISAIHDRLLALAGSAWHDVRPIQLDLANEQVDLLRRELGSVIERDLASAPVWAVKDPRSCRIMPLWKEILGELVCQPAAIIVVRHPLEVAGSLARRNGFSTAHSLLLWLRYNLEAEFHTRDWRRVFVGYETLLVDPLATVRRVENTLELGLPSPRAAVKRAIEKFVDPSLRHHAASDPQPALDPRLGDWIEQAYAALSAAAAGDESSLRDVFDAIRAQLKAGDAVFTPLLGDSQATVQRLEEQNERLTQATGEIIDLREQLDRAGDLLSSQRENLAVAEQELTTRDARIQDMEEESSKQHEVTERRVEMLETVGDRQAAWFDQATQILQHLKDSDRQIEDQQQREALQTALAERETETAVVRERLSVAVDKLLDREQECEKLQGALAAREAGTAAIRKSLSIAHDHLNDREHQLEMLRERLANSEAVSERITAMVAGHEATIVELEATIAGHEATVVELEATIGRLTTEVQVGSELRRALAEEHEAAAARSTARESELLLDLGQQRATVESLELRLGQSDQAARLHAAQARELEAQVGAVLRSRSYRVAAPLRMVSRATRTTLGGIKRLPRVPWAVARWCFQGLPGSAAKKYQLKSFLFSHFGFLFRRTNAYRTWQNLQRTIRDARPALRPVGAAPVAASLVDHAEGNAEENAGEEPTSPPLASIVIPVYGQIAMTLACLDSIRDAGSTVPFEVVVVDDASDDEDHAALALRDDIVLVRNTENCGFIKSCNRGAAASQGSVVVFLNNDTIVRPAWLDELVATLELRPDVGLVGARIVYPAGSDGQSGRLQEAGGILWRDGSAWNYGKDDDASHPRYLYAREVDYCSGACIALRSSLFQQLAGFDEHFAPAYGEDSDLALRVQALGMQVVYQPLACIEHYEGASSGTEETQGVKKHQPINARKLYERWKDTLRTHREPGQNAELEKDRRICGRVLFLDACTPTPDQDAGSLTALGIMQTFQALGYKVTFVPEDNFLYMNGYTSDLQRIGIECLYSPYYDSVQALLEERGSEFDVVVVFRHGVAAKYLKVIRTLAPGARIVFHTSDLHFLREQRQNELAIAGATSTDPADTKRRELDVIAQADCTIVHSTAEKALLIDELPDAFVYTFPWILELAGRHTPFSERRDIAFLGGYGHPPNVDAARYFATEILPLVRERLPDVRFHIVGANPPSELLDLASESVIVTGYVADLAQCFDVIRVAVAPIRYGAGIKGKLAMAMSYGVPNVATTVAAEGMELEHGTHVLVADDPGEFADSVVRLYEDEALWSEISAAGCEYIEEGYSVRLGQDRVAEILEGLGSPPFDATCPACGNVGLTSRLGCSKCGASSVEVRMAGALLALADGSEENRPGNLAAWACEQDLPSILLVGELSALSAALGTAKSTVHKSQPLGDGDTLDIPEGLFDIVVSGDALARHEDDSALLDLLRRHVRSGGWHLICPPYDVSCDEEIALHNNPRERVKQLAHHIDPKARFDASDGSTPLRRIYGRGLLTQLTRGGDRVSVWDADGSHHGLCSGQPALLIRRAENVEEPDDQQRLIQEIEAYRHVENVHDLPEIFHYWANRNLRPILESCGIDDLDLLFVIPIAKACAEAGDEETVRVLSLGAGNCDFEVGLAEQLISDGWERFEFHCLELNPHMLERGCELARSRDVISHFKFIETDVTNWKPDCRYHVCMANQSLHHFTALEALFKNVRASLEPEGVFAVSDIIGRNGHMRWPEALEIVHELWREMPDRYKFNHALARFESIYENWDCSTESNEGIRAQDILKLLCEHFSFEVFVAWGNLIDIFLEKGFGHNFDPNVAEDRAFIDALADRDEDLIDKGLLTPTHLVALLRVDHVAETRSYADREPALCIRDPLERPRGH